MRFNHLAAVAALSTGLGACAEIGFPTGVLDPTLPPASGEVSLAAGFPGNPWMVAVVGGGDQGAGGLGPGCVGMVKTAPDFRLTYTAVEDQPLTIAAMSHTDATLVIRGPDGRYYCDDDSAGGLDPSYTFVRPQSGVYDVWVGMFEGWSDRAILYIAED